MEEPQAPDLAAEEEGSPDAKVLRKFTLYETKSRYYLVGTNRTRSRFRILKIDRTLPNDLFMTEDPKVYNAQEMALMREMIDQGNKAAGGMKIVCSACGVLGFVRFCQSYFLILITKKSKVGTLGGHFVYSIDETRNIELPHPSFRTKRYASEEVRYRNIFFSLDVRNQFFFSYTYDMTHTLQHNMVTTAEDNTANKRWKFNKRFVWNHFLIKRLKKFTHTDEWTLPCIHGYFKQCKFSVFGRTLNITLIARRSRYFAGTRFLKRGVTDEGHVANDVESEQIVHEVSSGNHNFHNFSSFVQIRGSIPLFWAQENALMVPKPPITMQQRDPFYAASIKHFEDLFRRYGCPVVILNLIKSAEKKPREGILLKELEECVLFLNSLLPPEKQIVYIPWDFHKASKGKHPEAGTDAISHLAKLAEESLARTGFFHSGQQLTATLYRKGEPAEPGGVPYGPGHKGRAQNGVIRTNCIDNLDRTNAAQFIVGKCALGHQLYAMGMTDKASLDFSKSEEVVILMDLYQDMGNNIALQYGGSQLVNTMQTYSINSSNTITSQSRDLLTTVKRFYSNSFTDAEKQESINLFLGNYIPYKHGPLASPHNPHLWELESDNYLHFSCNSCISPDVTLLSSTTWWEDPLQEFAKALPITKGKEDKNATDNLPAESGPATSPKGEKDTDAEDPSTPTATATEKENNDGGSASAKEEEIAPTKVSVFEEGICFDEFYRTHTLTCFDKELNYGFNEPELSTSSMDSHSQQDTRTLRSFMDNSNPPGAQYIGGIKRWVWWSRQIRAEEPASPAEHLRTEEGLMDTVDKEAQAIYGIALGVPTEQEEYYFKYMDMDSHTSITKESSPEWKKWAHYLSIQKDATQFLTSAPNHELYRGTVQLGKQDGHTQMSRGQDGLEIPDASVRLYQLMETPEDLMNIA